MMDRCPVFCIADIPKTTLDLLCEGIEDYFSEFDDGDDTDAFERIVIIDNKDVFERGITMNDVEDGDGLVGEPKRDGMDGNIVPDDLFTSPSNLRKRPRSPFRSRSPTPAPDASGNITMGSADLIGPNLLDHDTRQPKRQRGWKDVPEDSASTNISTSQEMGRSHESVVGAEGGGMEVDEDIATRSDFLGHTLQGVCDWFDKNITQPDWEGFTPYCFLVLDDKSTEDGTCIFVCTQDSAPGEIHSLRCTFDLAMVNVIACSIQGHSIEEGVAGNFMRSGVTMTKENYKLAMDGGLYMERGEVKLDQYWRDFSNL